MPGHYTWTVWIKQAENDVLDVPSPPHTTAQPHAQGWRWVNGALNFISVYSDLRPVVKSVRRAGSLPHM